ncbi:MAG: chromate transporter [Oscillospiraceae bacterium]|nr:chromate transporter [Oscillospiraceae bacterium]
MSLFLELFITFFQIGLFTFGGGYAMLPLIQEAVLEHGWLAEEEIINFIAISESTPGPFAINISTYVGTETGTEAYGLLGGFIGGACATLGVVLPSFIVILIVAQFYKKFKESSAVKGVMTGLKPAVIGLIGSALLSIFITVFFSGLSFTFAGGLAVDETFNIIKIVISALICILMTVLVFKKVHPIIIIVLSAALGIATGYICGF